MPDEEMRRQIEELDRELVAISQDLQRAIDTAGANVLMKSGQIVPGLVALHHRVTTRSDEIISLILELRRKLFGSSE
jgi:hypothetical protein